MVEEHLRTKGSVAELAKAHGLHRSWAYKLLARYRRYGEEGLVARSRRPKTSPGRIADRYENEIVALRKQLSDKGFDAGAQTIFAYLARRGRLVAPQAYPRPCPQLPAPALTRLSTMS